MKHEHVKQIMTFLDTIDTTKLIQLCNDAGFNIGRYHMVFNDIDEVTIVRHLCRVKVSFIDNDRCSETYGEDGQIHFDIDATLKVQDLDFVQKV